MPSIRASDASIEYQFWGPATDEPPVLLLHEALGNVRGWGEWPGRLAESLGRRVYAYSRQGHGGSDPLEEPLGADYVQREALEVLPEVRERLQLLDELVVVGLHDGAAIALAHAGGSELPVCGVAALSPLVLVDETTRAAVWSLSDLPPSLARTHADQEKTVSQWIALWTSAQFQGWNIDDFLFGVTCPVLAARGDKDEFTSPAHVERLAALLHQLEVVKLPGCRHAPHLDKPGVLTIALDAFLRQP